MAAKSAIGMMRNDALERIEAALPGFEMPRQGNDAMLLHAKQLQAIAEFLECQQQKTTKEDLPIENGLTAMRSMEVGPATFERLEAFAAAVNVEDAPIKEAEPKRPATSITAPKGRKK